MFMLQEMVEIIMAHGCNWRCRVSNLSPGTLRQPLAQRQLPDQGIAASVSGLRQLGLGQC